jgi:hypothetical protein
MNEERMQVLRMLEEGKITAEEADRLLDAVGGTPEKPKSREGKQLTIRVTDRTTRKQKVNMTIPLGLAKIAAKFVPPKAKKKLAAEGVDVDQVLSQVLSENIGKIVDVETEDDIVQITIE